MSIASAARAHIMRNFIQKEKERIISSFTADPTTTHRAITKVVKHILLNGPYLINGAYWEVKARSLGAGVYELSLELPIGTK